MMLQCKWGGTAGLLAAMVGLLGVSAQATRAQGTYHVSIDTTGLSGIGGLLAFDLTGGDSISPNNSTLVTSFGTDGILAAGGNTNTPGASGDLPGSVSITDQQFFNESARGITLGSHLSFTVSVSANFAPPGTPDEFSFFLLSPDGTSSLVPTSDPSGANALLTLDLDGTPQGAATLFDSLTPDVSVSTAPVPEPSSVVLLAVGLLSLLAAAGRRRRVARAVSW